MEKRIFEISKIDGEYAYLRDASSGEELFIAMALLLPEIDIGTRLAYENLEFSVIE